MERSLYMVNMLQDLSDNDLGHQPYCGFVIGELLRTNVFLETLKLAGLYELKCRC